MVIVNLHLVRRNDNEDKEMSGMQITSAQKSRELSDVHEDLFKVTTF